MFPRLSLQQCEAGARSALLGDLCDEPWCHHVHADRLADLFKDDRPKIVPRGKSGHRAWHSRPIPFGVLKVSLFASEGPHDSVVWSDRVRLQVFVREMACDTHLCVCYVSPQHDIRALVTAMLPNASLTTVRLSGHRHRSLLDSTISSILSAEGSAIVYVERVAYYLELHVEDDGEPLRYHSCNNP